MTEPRKKKKQYTYENLRNDMISNYDIATSSMISKTRMDANKDIFTAIQNKLLQIVSENGWNVEWARQDLAMDGSPRSYPTELMHLMLPLPPRRYESIWNNENIAHYAGLMGMDYNHLDDEALETQVEAGHSELDTLMKKDTTFHNLPYLLFHYPLLACLIPKHILDKYRKNFQRRPHNPYAEVATSNLTLMIIQARSLGVLDAK